VNDVDGILNSKPLIAAFSALEIGAGLIETAAGAALVIGGAAATAGTAGVASSVSVPTIVLGAATFTLGTLTTVEASYHLQGALTGNKSLMEFDALGDVGKAKGTLDLVRNLRRPFSGGVKGIALRATSLLRYLDQVYRDLRKGGICPGNNK